MKKLLVVVVAFLGLIFSQTSRVHASVNDFVINDFTADYYLTRNDPQGQMRIVERIDLTFSDYNHGILRAIPKSYKGHSLKLNINKVSSDMGAPSQYTTYGDSGNTVLKIGDPNRTLTGHQKYTIDYTLQNVVTFYGDHDELYWDINGDQWQQPFMHVKAIFHLPADLKLTDQKCYAGVYSNIGQDCTITKTAEGANAETNSPLSGYQTLTAIMAFPAGYFAKPTSADWWRDNYGEVLAIVLPPLLIGGWAYRRWSKHGRDLKGRGTIIPEYEPPKGVSPAEAGVISAYHLSQKDVSATIIDLAIRKYLRINEVIEKKILKDKKTYEFELLNTDWAALKSHESKVMEGLFTTISVGEVTSLKSLKTSFYKTVQSLKSSLPKDLTTAGYFPVNPGSAGGLLWGLTTAAFILAFIFHSWISIGLAIAAIMAMIFAVLMPSRTAAGVEALEKIKGLKMYMETAEKDRIKMLQSPDAPYANKSTGPKQTVELFEKLLPYAIVLGVENEWAKQFADIYKTPPDWYNGNWTTFNAIYLTSALANSVSAMSTNFSPPSSSGSSGISSGGGFSGGGGGGGGGGGW